MSFSLTDTTNSDLDWSLFVFKDIKNEILGEDYSLSLAFVDEEASQTANRTYRQKDNATDVLSFPLSESEGEILICPEIAQEKAEKFGYSLASFFLYLFIHGCAHLKGYDHGDEMEQFEESVRKKFQVKEK